MHTVLTEKQKLVAMSLRFYQGLKWDVKTGDYYTSSRADLELYRVVKVEGEVVQTEYCNNPGQHAEWAKAGFTTEGFGPSRVYVPDFVFEPTT